MNSSETTNDGALTVKVMEARSGKARPWHAWVFERNAHAAPKVD